MGTLATALGHGSAGAKPQAPLEHAAEADPDPKPFAPPEFAARAESVPTNDEVEEMLFQAIGKTGSWPMGRPCLARPCLPGCQPDHGAMTASCVAGGEMSIEMTGGRRQRTAQP